MSHPGVDPCRLKVPLGFCSVLAAPNMFLSHIADKWAVSSFSLQLFKEAQTCVVGSAFVLLFVKLYIKKINLSKTSCFCAQLSHTPGFTSIKFESINSA